MKHLILTMLTAVSFENVAATSTQIEFGLPNPSNQNLCFMNSILQCLAHIPQFYEYFGTNKFRNDISDNTPTYGNVVEGFATLVETINTGISQLQINDQAIQFHKNVVQNHLSTSLENFGDFQQHDAEEFGSHLLDKMDSELNQPSKIQQWMNIQTIDINITDPRQPNTWLPPSHAGNVLRLQVPNSFDTRSSAKLTDLLDIVVMMSMFYITR